MQCVSYKQICYQAVNTKVMGLLVLISVFLYIVQGFFFPLYSSRFRAQLCIFSGQGSSCFLHALCSSGCVLSQTSHLQPPSVAEQLSPPWLSPCWDNCEDGEGQEKHSLSSLSLRLHSVEMGLPGSNRGATRAGKRQGRQERTNFHLRSCSMERELPCVFKYLSLERKWSFI